MLGYPISCASLSQITQTLIASYRPPVKYQWKPRIRIFEEIANKVSEWMQLCGVSGDLPKRVLKLDRSIVRLCDSPGKRGRYAALSHCWGNFPILTTTRSNFRAHERGIDWRYLGKTFQDAITLTRSLDIQYIWIDCLCIIQDSKSDWKAQSVKWRQYIRTQQSP